MFATTIAILLVLGVAANATSHNDRPFAGVNPNTLTCDPLGLVELLLPHHSDCTRFYQCVHGREVSRNCARPLIFDFEIQNCAWRHETACRVRGDWDESSESDENEGDGGGNSGDQGSDQGGDNGESDKPMAGVDPNTLSCDPEGKIFLLLPHHTDCTKYYQCSNGREILMPACPRPLIFDFELQGCNWEWDATCNLRTPEGGDRSEEKKSSEEEEDSSDGEGQQSGSSDSSDTEKDEVSEKSESDEKSPESDELVSKSKEDSDDKDSIEKDSGSISEEGSGDSEEQVISGEGSGGIDVTEEDEDIDGSGSGDGDGDLNWLEEPQSKDQLDILAKLTGLMQAIRPVANAQDVSKTHSLFRSILDCSRSDSAARHVAHKTDCQRFWRCVSGVPQTFYCSDGLFFNEISQQCDFEANVRCLAGQDDELAGEFIVYNK